jgi:hypothetical protein
MNIIFWIDLNAPDVDVLTEDPQNGGEPKIDDSWSPYESKMGSSKLFDPQRMIKHTFLSIIDVPPRYP